MVKAGSTPVTQDLPTTPLGRRCGLWMRGIPCPGTWLSLLRLWSPNYQAHMHTYTHTGIESCICTSFSISYYMLKTKTSEKFRVENIIDKTGLFWSRRNMICIVLALLQCSERVGLALPGLQESIRTLNSEGDVRRIIRSVLANVSGSTGNQSTIMFGTFDNLRCIQLL